MHMCFWFSADFGDFLFRGYTITSTLGLIATCFGLAAVVIVYDALKLCNAKVQHQSSEAKLHSQKYPLGNSHSSETSALILSGHKGKFYRTMWLLTKVVLYLSQEWLNWLIMMAVMSYNGYIFFAAIGGAAIGYTIFGESLINIKVHGAKMKAASISCGECQGESQGDTAVLTEALIGQSEPPSEVIRVSTPTRMISVTDVIVHHSNSGSSS